MQAVFNKLVPFAAFEQTHNQCFICGPQIDKRLLANFVRIAAVLSAIEH